MSDEPEKSTDVLGIAPLARAIERTTDASLRGAGEFLSRICLPAAEEFGHMLQDQVRSWRLRNMARIAKKAENYLESQAGSSHLKAPPRVAMRALDEGSWTNEPGLQDMWAGLLASSCSPDGDDDSNLMFVDLLSQLTHTQVKLIDYAVRHCKMQANSEGFVLAEGGLYLQVDQLAEATGIDDLQRLDRELDHLRQIGLIGASGLSGGFQFSTATIADVTPASLAIHLYVRCHGSRQPPIDYFDVERPASEEPQTSG